MPQVIRVGSEGPLQNLEAAVPILQRDGVVALPTETYYGLAVNPFSERALERLFLLKNRPPEKPPLLLLGHLEMLSEVVAEVPPWSRVLMERFWPGPLTLVFKARSRLPKALTADTGTVAVRLSSHLIPTKLSQLFGHPITGTSANRSGHPAATTAEKVQNELPKVDLILDGGETPGGAPSTIVAVISYPPRLLRPGKISFEEIMDSLRKN